MRKVKELSHYKDVINCFNKHKGAYGRIRIKKSLQRKNINVSECKISRILKENGLVSKYGRPQKRKHPRPTKAQYLSENLVKKKFEIDKKNTLWCADISEFKYSNGKKIFVSGVIDVGVRKLVGWSIATHSRQEIVHDAIEMAYNRCRPKEGLIFHCDRGCQYTSNDTKVLLDEFKMISSMSRPGSPTDNQPIETFWKTMKTEMDDISKMKFKEAKRTIVEYIELFYNNERIHTSLEYRTPNEVWDSQF
jgi:putative transposase